MVNIDVGFNLFNIWQFIYKLCKLCSIFELETGEKGREYEMLCFVHNCDKYIKKLFIANQTENSNIF